MLSPHLSSGLPELGGTDQVGEEDAGNGGHGPASVGQLTLDVPLEGVLVGGTQAEGVEAVVSAA